MASFSKLNTTLSMNGILLPASRSSPAASSPGAPSLGYGSPGKLGLRSSTICRFGLFTVIMYGPAPTGYQSSVRFFSAMPGCE